MSHVFVAVSVVVMPKTIALSQLKAVTAMTLHTTETGSLHRSKVKGDGMGGIGLQHEATHVDAAACCDHSMLFYL